MTSSPFSDWIVYVDESGDHGLSSIDPTYPIFVLVFVLFRKNTYINRFVPALGALKFRLFGHDGVILHEREIRKVLGPFVLLRDPDKKEQFIEEIGSIVERTPHEVLATVHDKRRMVGTTDTIEHLYHQALRFGLERLHERLSGEENYHGVTHVVCEARGAKEDRELEAAFESVCAGHNAIEEPLPFRLVVTDKRANSAGLQLADLMARPVGLHVLRPEQPNRAFEFIREKLMTDPTKRDSNWGLRCFP